VKGSCFSGLRVAAALTFLCPLAAAQQVGRADPPATSTPTTVQRGPAAPVKPSALTAFAWLEGHWRGEWGTRVAEQEWLGPQAGLMPGIFRLTEGDKTLVMELFSIVEKPEGVQFYLRHFTPELLPWEKTDATTLKLESSDATHAVFVNPVNGEPKRATLTRVDADTYTARSEIEPEKGEPQTIEITFHRVKPPAPPSGGNAGRRKKP